MTVLFLVDRDGTINDLAGGHIVDASLLTLIEGAGKAINILNSLGEVNVVTNQSIIGRGWASPQELTILHDRLDELLALENGSINNYYYCPHTSEDGCSCRKPATGLFDKIKKDISFKEVWMIGDNKSDILFGNAVGAKTILVETGYGVENKKQCDPDYIFKDLLTAAHFLKEKMNNG